MADKHEVYRLKELAYQQRVALLRLSGYYQGQVHLSGDMSCTDILIALYNHAMNVDPDDIMMPTRDRFVLSKGHGAVCMYFAMALRGFFDVDDIIQRYGKLDAPYGTHPCKVQLPGVENSSGSLGHGLAIATGMAAKARVDGEKHRVYTLMGDGETCEGSIWEAAMVASSLNLGNLIGIVDRNKQMMTSFTEDTVRLEPYCDKWRAFGWNIIEIDGHDMNQIVETLDNLPSVDSSIPTVIVANTVKGHGVSLMTKKVEWHSCKLSQEDMEKCIQEVTETWERERSEWQ